MFFILFRNSPSLLLLIFPSPFSTLPLIFCNFLRLSFFLVCLRLSLSPYLSRVSHQFSTLFFLYFSRFSLTLLPRTVFYFPFSLYFPRLSVSVSLLIAVRGHRYLKPFTAPAAVSLGDSRLYTGLMGISARQWFCVHAQRNII